MSKTVTELPKTKQLKGGQLWTRKKSGVDGYSSEDGNYDILINHDKGYVVLVSFQHEPIDACEFWRKQFPTVEAAMEYAEKM
jgi:hypothetical protein